MADVTSGGPRPTQGTTNRKRQNGGARRHNGAGTRRSKPKSKERAGGADRTVLLATVMDHMAQGVVVVDGDLTIAASNRQAAQLLDVPGDMLAPGADFETVIRHAAARGDHGPGDPGKLAEQYIGIARAAQATHFERVRPDGTVLEVHLAPRPGGGFISTFTDVTGLKRHERAVADKTALLDTALDNMAEGLIVFDSDAIILAANERARQLLDLPAEMLRPGADFIDVIRLGAGRGDYGPGDPDELTKKYAAVTKSREARHHERDLPNGTVLEIRVRPRPEGGQVVSYADITESKRYGEKLAGLNAQLKVGAEELERSNKELEQFAYIASHDLQEPLRMVGSYCQLLQRRYKDKLDEDADEFIAFAVDGANRMKVLINDLLTYSRVGTEGKPLEPTDAAKVLEAALQNLEVAVGESGANITSGTLPTVEADEVQLVQLLQNLIGNAIKFRGDGPPEIHVGAEAREGGWLFSVRDNGVGIDPEYGERIFQIFQRLHGKSEIPGTGIGLAVCRKIVERHGGRIWVEPGTGGGSVFKFTLAGGRRAE